MAAILDQSPTGYRVPEIIPGAQDPCYNRLRMRVRGQTVELGPAPARSIRSAVGLLILISILLSPAVPLVVWGIEYHETLGLLLGGMFSSIAIAVGIGAILHSASSRSQAPFISATPNEVRVAGRSFPRYRLQSIEYVALVESSSLPARSSVNYIDVVVVERAEDRVRHTLLARIPSRLRGIDRQVRKFAESVAAPLIPCAATVIPSLELSTCRFCGYDLTGLSAGRCPECGKQSRLGRAQAVPQAAGFVPRVPRQPCVYLRLTSSGGSTRLVVDRWNLIVSSIGVFALPIVLAWPACGLAVWLSNLAGVPGWKLGATVVALGIVIAELVALRGVRKDLRDTDAGTLFEVGSDGLVRVGDSTFHRDTVDSVKEVGVRAPAFDEEEKPVGVFTFTCLALARHLPDARLTYETVYPNIHPGNFVGIALAARLGVPLDREEMDAPTTGEWARNPSGPTT